MRKKISGHLHKQAVLNKTGLLLWSDLSCLVVMPCDSGLLPRRQADEEEWHEHYRESRRYLATSQHLGKKSETQQVI